MTSERCLVRALLMIFAIWPDLSSELKSSRKSWCKAFLTSMFNIVVSGEEVENGITTTRGKNLGTDRKVIGRKLAGSLAFYVLRIRIVQARFHSLGTDPVDQAVRMISDK